MSTVGESGSRLPPEWSRLERAVEEAAAAVRRAGKGAQPSEEVQGLNRTIEELRAECAGMQQLRRQLDEVRHENAALRRRMQQARKRVGSLMQKLAALEREP